MMKSVAALFALSTLMLGCAVNTVDTNDKESKNTLTTGQVQITLKKDVTTQPEVLEAFGAPNLVSLNSEGEEVWTYQRNATVANATSSSAYGTIILLGASKSAAGLEQSSRTMTLIIKFKELNGVKKVSNFSSRSSSF